MSPMRLDLTKSDQISCIKPVCTSLVDKIKNCKMLMHSGSAASNLFYYYDVPWQARCGPCSGPLECVWMKGLEKEIYGDDG